MSEPIECALEAIDLTPPRLRVLMVGHPANAVDVNKAAAELEMAGFAVHGYQFETWVDSDGDMNAVCWITYELPDGVVEGPDLYENLARFIWERSE